jgi:uncharacterized membrane protein YhiD involved in acid resistance
LAARSRIHRPPSPPLELAGIAGIVVDARSGGLRRGHWATAGVGLAVGSGEFVLGAVGTGLIVFGLGPLNRLVARWRGNRFRLLRLRVELSSITGLGRVTALAVSSGAEVVGLESRKLSKGRYEVELALRLVGGHATSEIVSSIGALGGAEVIDASDAAE